ncbi:MAG: portal protein [Bacilli bacterium]
MANFFDMFKFWQREDEEQVRQQEQDMRVSFAAPDKKDGATEVVAQDDSNYRYNSFQQNFFSNSEPKIKTTRDLVNSYRALAEIPEVDNAVQEIIFDAIVFEDDKDPVHLDLSSTDFSDRIQEMIHKEMANVLRLYNFNKEGTRIFRRWYVDSRSFYHKILHKDPKKGIQELRPLDPRKMEYLREITKETKEGVDYITKTSEYFIYSNEIVDSTNAGMAESGSINKIKIPRSMVVYAHSGLTDCSGRNIIGYLHKAQKPANQLKMLEDSLVIYRITRAPERRIFYIDVGNMPNKKATQHVNNIMQGLKNRVVYDSSTGKVKNQFNNLSMTEDYWLMRRDGKATTEVSTLPGAQSLGSIDDVNYFNKKLYESLHLPLSRIPNEGGGVQFGGGSEITRDEVKFNKLVKMLRQDFKEVLSDPLHTNLILKGIITEDEWKANENKIRYVFINDSFFEEQKEIEILQGRVNVLESIREYIGRYVSHDYAMRNILKMSSEEIDEQRKLIESELDDPIYKDPALELEEEI